MTQGDEISQQYARELARQVDELEAENAKLRAALRDAHGLIDNDLVVPWIMAHKLDDILNEQLAQKKRGGGLTMMRMKTEIEVSETPKQEAERLRHALFTIRELDDIEEMKRVAVAAMSGELHGYEIPSDVQQPPYAPIVPMWEKGK